MEYDLSPFNRTSVELKLSPQSPQPPLWLSFNRTSVELKHFQAHSHIYLKLRF